MNKLWLAVVILGLALAAWWWLPAARVGEVPVVVDAAGEGEPGRVGSVASRAALPDAQPLPAGLPGAGLLRGSVRDEADHPVADVEVVVRSAYELPFPAQFALRARTGSDGAFAFGPPVPAGSWRVEVTDRVVLAPRAVAIVAGGEPAPLELRVEVRDAHATITGIVVDDDQRPLPEVWVEARGEPGRFVLRTRSRTDGQFVLTCPGRARGTVALGWTRSDLSSSGSAGRVPWGTTGVRIEAGGSNARVRTELDLLVVGPNAATVVDYAVRGSGRPGLLAQGPHPEGRVRVPIEPGHGQFVFVQPASQELVAAGPEWFDAEPGQGVPLAVTLRRATTLPVRVQRPDGTPVAGERVELLRPWGDRGIDERTRAAPLADPSPWAALQVDAAVTDAIGLARLRAPAGETGLVVRVLGPHCAVRVVDDVAIPTGIAPPLVIVAEAGGTIVVRVRGGESLVRYRGTNAPGPVLALTPHSLPLDRNLTPDTCWPLGAEGTARIAGVATGAWDVRLLFWLQSSPLDRVALWNPQLPPQTVSLRPGESKAIEFDAETLLPGRVSGRVVQDGVPVANAPVQVGFGQEPRSFLVTDADGCLRIPVARPGHLTLAVEQLQPATGNNTWLFGHVQLPPGGTLDQDLAVRRD